MTDREGLRIESVHAGSLDDLGKLLCTDDAACGCWCMWFITSVREYHAAGIEGNRARFAALAASSDDPMGLLAYRDDEPVGWCAVGPRSRYKRALKTPTYRGGDDEDDASIWLVPCFFVHPDERRSGLTRELLDAAVSLATDRGARAIEGFPFAGQKRRSSGDRQVGFESLFTACGFTAVRRPSASRVVMRRELSV